MVQETCFHWCPKTKAITKWRFLRCPNTYDVSKETVIILIYTNTTIYQLSHTALLLTASSPSNSRICFTSFGEYLVKIVEFIGRSDPPSSWKDLSEWGATENGSNIVCVNMAHLQCLTWSQRMLITRQPTGGIYDNNVKCVTGRIDVSSISWFAYMTINVICEFSIKTLSLHSRH